MFFFVFVLGSFDSVPFRSIPFRFVSFVGHFPFLVMIQGESAASNACCWNDILSEFECGICFDVLIGVHVLGE